MTTDPPPGNRTILSANHWRINVNLAYGVPGYLFIQHLASGTGAFAGIPPDHYQELGQMIGLATSAQEECLNVPHVLCGKFGLVPGHPLHFHLLPLHDWITRAFARDARYHALQSLNPPDYPIAPDAAELIAFVWREYCATGHCPVDNDRERVADKLHDYFTENRSAFGL